MALHWTIGERVLGMVMAFGSGVVISAVAFERVEEAFITSHGDGRVALGLFSPRWWATARSRRRRRRPSRFVLAFAAGAILTMLADTMMPEAFEHGGKLVGVVTTFGFALAFAISALE